MKITDILDGFGFKYKKSGDDNAMMCCPFHKDSSPSFAVNLASGAYICFACGAKGKDIVSLYARLNGVSREEAENSFGHEYGNLMFNNKLNRVEVSETNYTKSVPIHVNVLSIFKFDESNDIISKLNTTIETAKSARLSICTDKKYVGRLAIPIDGFWELRDLTKKSSKKVLYTKGTKTSELLYSIDNKKNFEECFLVEGVKDVLTIEGFGLKAVSCFGTNVSSKQISKMLNLGIKKLKIMYDGDEAGSRAYNKNINKLTSVFECERIDCPKDKDPNDLDKDTFVRLINAR